MGAIYVRMHGKTFQNHSNGEPEITKYGEKALISSPFVHTCKTRTLFLTNIYIYASHLVHIRSMN